MNAELSDIDGPAAWTRLAIALAASTVGGIGLWSVVVTLPAIEADFGLSRGDASMPYFVTMIGFATGGILMGRLLDRFGIFPPLVLGAIMLGIGYISISFAPNVWVFSLIQGIVIGMLGSAATFAPLVADISHWFDKRRGIAVAIVASGNYLSGTIWPPIISWGIETVGWRETHVWIGITCLCIMLPLAFFLRHRPPAHDEASETRTVAPMPFDASPRLVQGLLIFAGLACCVAMSMPQVHIVAYCGDLGYGVARGAEMLSLMLALGVVSRLVSGLIADKIGGVATLLLGSTLQCIALFFFIPFDGLVSLYIVSALFGLAQGGIVPSYALIVRKYFPAREAGTRVSVVLMTTVVGMALGGWISGEIYDLTGSYRAAFWNGIGWNLLNMSIAAWFLLGGRPANTGRTQPA